MNWVKENKFLAGLIGATVVGAGAFGYLLYSAKAHADEANQSFESQAAELNRLQHLPAYPDQENLAKLQAQRDEHVGMIDKLQKELAAVKEPVESLTPREFQDHLRDAVTKFTKDAEGKMALPKTFYMGFDRYQSAPPTDEAAPLLGRELNEVLAVLNILLDARVTELRRFERDELPEEGGKAAKAPADAAKPAPSGGGKKGRGSDFLHKRGMDMTFTAEQPSFQTALNRLTSGSKTHFFVPRYLAVNNTNPKPPPKEAPVVAVAAPETPPPGTPPTAGTPTGTPPGTLPGATPGTLVPKIIVGEELVEVTMRLEVLDFAEPEPPTGKGKRSPSN